MSDGQFDRLFAILVEVSSNHRTWRGEIVGKRYNVTGEVAKTQSGILGTSTTTISWNDWTWFSSVYNDKHNANGRQRTYFTQQVVLQIRFGRIIVKDQTSNVLNCISITLIYYD